jgi:hypothetical protein
MAEYRFRKYYVPDRMMVTIRNYVDEGWPVEEGGFLEALICHRDVFIVIGRADDENLENLPAFCAYFHNEVPAACHGSVQAYQKWVEQFANGRKVKEAALKEVNEALEREPEEQPYRPPTLDN